MAIGSSLKKGIKYFLKLFAFNIIFYREVYARSLGFIAGMMGKSALGVESYIRGLTWRHLSNGRPIHIGRYVVLNGSRGKISLGENVRINSFCYLTVEGQKGHIRIGDNSHVDSMCCLHGHGGLEIGQNCGLGSGTVVYTQRAQIPSKKEERWIDFPIIFAKVIIEDDVAVGSGCTILPGVRIGKGANLGAGSLVGNDISAFSHVIGMPGKIIKKRMP